MKTFYQVLINTLIAAVTNNFIWFAVTYWAYLETHSVLATSLVGGGYLVMTAVSGLWFGSVVDHNKKKSAMLLSSGITLLIFCLSLALYLATPEQSFTTVANPVLWIFIALLLLGVIVGNIRTIALPTLVTLLIAEDERDKANGLVGMMMGIAFSITAFGSGLVLGYWNMAGVLIISIVGTVAALLHLATLEIPEKEIIHTVEKPKKLDLPGTIRVIRDVPGLFGLIFFNTFNNLLGGVFMSLMDAYGLTLVSVQVWGVLWGVLSMGFILGGVYVSKKGLGNDPLRRLFLTNVVLWTISIFFTIQPSIWLLAVGMLLYISIIPIIEAAEQTILQKVVPYERQGRVFGFAQSVEQSASPLTAFLIGPIAQFIFIPFMTTGRGVELIGGWFGTGPGRGIALVFIATGIIGLIITVVAMKSRSYHLLRHKYQET